MNIYLSASYARREEMERYARVLYQHNIEVVSRWVFQENEELETELRQDGLEAHPNVCNQIARDDLDDIQQCDMFVMFTDGPDQTSYGGRHVEMGFALALRKPVLICGPIENVFQMLDTKVKRVSGIEGVIEWVIANS
ncbi:MAG: hypothetical protein GY847_14480 [Proteobacteria bacterium]|nr:hypothetical protein [Pseudomonadota bacterium]